MNAEVELNETNVPEEAVKPEAEVPSPPAPPSPPQRNQVPTTATSMEPLTPSDERTWAMLAHLSVLLNLVTGYLEIHREHFTKLCRHGSLFIRSPTILRHWDWEAAAGWM